MTPQPEAHAQPASDSRPWVPAGLIAVLAADIIDVVLATAPLAAGLVLPGPAWVRLVLIIMCPLAVLHLLDCHGRHGRWAGGALLGLRTVDEEAGLPTGTPRGLIAQAALGRAVGAMTVDARRGPDPSRGPLGEAPRIETPAPRRPRCSSDRDQSILGLGRSSHGKPALDEGRHRPASPQREMAPSPFRRSRVEARPSTLPASQADHHNAAWATPQPGPPRPSDVPPPPPAPSAAAFGPAPAPPASQPWPPSAPAPRSTRMDISAPAPSTASPTAPPGLPPAVSPHPSLPPTAPIPSPQYALRLRSAHGWTWLLSSPTIIGGATRQIPALAPHGTVDIPATGDALSDNHAHLELLDGSLYLADLGSASGTRIIGLGGVIQQCAPSTRYRVPLPCTIELGAVRLSAELERLPA
ncbi:FHA domain-containing protein [Actinomyces timonensis]|uniref:FHA domain-containing protein n=1 Tax=Actinomyces timonensis TaxID=1288391 RepID=A0AAU8N5B4_9ACTO